jgi:hypothetical protein
MRSPRLALSAVILLAAGAAQAKDGCTVSVGPADVVKKTGEVVIEAGQVVDNAIALAGAVRVRRGAVVKTAVAVKGDVVVEDGGEVTETALALGGSVRVRRGGLVKGSTVQLKAGGLRIEGGDHGGKVSGDLSVDGESLSTKLLVALVGSLQDCTLEPKAN